VQDLAKDAALLWLSLLTLFNPPSAVAAFAALVKHFSADVQRRMARRVAIIYLAVMLFVTWGGRPLLRIMGLSLPALRVAGGFVLLLAAIPMVTQYQRADAREEAELENASVKNRSWHQLVAVPLTFPIALGGATVAAVIAAAGGGKLIVARAAMTSLACVLMAGVVWLTLRSAVPLTRHISRGSMAALTAASGMVLLCIAIQVIAAGVRELLPGLG
jgi:multiple antibiotic resistance protein